MARNIVNVVIYILANIHLTASTLLLLYVLYFVCDDANYRIELAGDTERVVMGEGPFR